MLQARQRRPRQPHQIISNNFMQEPQRWATVWVTMQAWADLEARPPVRWVGLQVPTYFISYFLESQM